MSFSYQHIAINRRNAPSATVRARVFGSVAVHREIDAHGVPVFKGRHAVTHIPTGLKVKSYATYAQAARVAAGIGASVEFTHLDHSSPEQLRAARALLVAVDGSEGH